MNYLSTDEEQYKYSKAKLPQLQDRFNLKEQNHMKEMEELKAKIERHASIITSYEVAG
jgi:hypothetical protein